MEDVVKQIIRLKNLIRVARGLREPDLLLKGGSVINVFTHEILHADVAISDGMIAGIGSYTGSRTMNLEGCYISPGFIDGHMHLESPMLCPGELAKAVLRHGTTAIMADPHEIANVMGTEGVRFLLDAAAGLPIDIYFLLPSCVPATDLETSGAVLTAGDLKPLRRYKRVIGLAEMMNYPGVLSGNDEVLEKLIAFRGGIRDGHAPLLSGRDLNAYIASGIRSDHECSELEEAREKLRLGMHIMIRQGTLAKNLKDLIPLVGSDNLSRFSLVTDDLHPHDLLEKGHLDHLVDLAMEEGLEPVKAIGMATYNTARYFGLQERGAVAPGYKADLLVLSSLKPIRVRSVIKDGRVVFDEDKPTVKIRTKTGQGKTGAINVKPFDKKALAIQSAGKRIRVIGLIPDQILTKQLILEPLEKDGEVVSDTKRDILKLVVVERHKGSGRIGRGFVNGFGLKEGALASSVSHDSHNIIAVGCSDDDIFRAVKAIEEMNGGLVAVCKGEVLSRLPLPVAGLISNRPLEDVASSWTQLRGVSHELGSIQPEPFMALSFLALPVIPELRLTDQGLVDVNLFKHVSIFADE
jgi:adenine deaminase